MRDDFAVIIISHGRPQCQTVSVLKECGYTGEYYIVVDDEDDTFNEYAAKHGLLRLHPFHKSVCFDIMDNFKGPNSIATFARNECWNLARKKNLKYFLMLDDDLKSLSFRYNLDGKLKGTKASNLDVVFSQCCEYIQDSNISCLGFGLAMDYIGGIERFYNYSKRSVMNTFFCRSDKQFDFCGRYSEDFITPVHENKIGNLFLGFTGLQAQFEVWEQGKEKQTGGCQGVYLDIGAYTLRFYAVIAHPDCIYIRESGEGLDNTTAYNNAYPKIISDRWRKP